LVFDNGAHTVVYGIGYAGVLYGSEDGGAFAWLGPAGKQVSAGLDASGNPDYYVINAQNQVDFVNPSSPLAPQTSQGRVVAGYASAIGATTKDTLYYIGPENQVYEWLYPDLQFFSFDIPLGFDAKQISAGVDASGLSEVFAIGEDNSVYVDDGNGWVNLDFAATAISATVDNTVYAIGLQGVVYVDRGSGFTSLGGAYLSISAGYDTSGNPDVYAIGGSNSVSVNDGRGWIGLGGFATELAATGEDIVYYRGQDPDSIYGQAAIFAPRYLGNLLLLDGANLNAVGGGIWSGYVAETNFNAPQLDSVTYVTGSWVVPSDSYESIWVGIDGRNNSPNQMPNKFFVPEQVGTHSVLTSQGLEYYAFWEINALTEQPITSMTVRPGDVISAYVEYISSGVLAGFFLLSITDDSRPNDSFATLQFGDVSGQIPQRNSAEWIVEGDGGQYFSPVYFADATAVIDGTSGPIGSPSWQSLALNLGDYGSTTFQSSTSILLNSGDAFLVTASPVPGVVGANVVTAVPASPVFNGPDLTRPAVQDKPRPLAVAPKVDPTTTGVARPTRRPAMGIDRRGLVQPRLFVTSPPGG
jgi:hypothetical protein